MSSTTAPDVADAYLNYVFKRFGASEIVRHDRDPRFMSKVFKSFNRMMRQQQRATLAYRPQANGQQERYIQTVVRAIRIYIEDVNQKDWDLYVNKLEFALNTSVHSELKVSSFYLVHGWHPRSTLDAMVPPYDNSVDEKNAKKWRNSVYKSHYYAIQHAADIHRARKQERAKKHNEKIDETTAQTIPREYHVGDSVWLYFDLVKKGLVKKFAHLWHGPFKIKSKINEFTYELDVSNFPAARFHPKVHIARLKPYYSGVSRPQESLNEADQPDLIDFDEALLPEDSWQPDEDADEYEVEAILSDRWIRQGKSSRWYKEYFVKWKGYDETTWVHEDDMTCGALLYEYDKNNKDLARFLSMQAGEENGDELSTTSTE
jgi:hypothetical protein